MAAQDKEPRSLRVSGAESVDRACDRFEAAWRSGERPQMESFLSGTQGLQQRALLEELVALELAYRTDRGEHPTLAEYVLRFPQEVALLHAAFVAEGLSLTARREPPRLKLVCPRGHKLRAAASRAGRTIKCPTCGQAVRVPGDDTIRVEAPGATRAGQIAELALPPLSPARESSKTLGRFELRELLGEGAFGAVHRAWDPQLEREVALKVPRSGLLTDQAEVERFVREARAAAQLRHPHIVAVFEAGKAGSTHYIAAAYVAGRTLEQALSQDRRYTPAEAAQLIAQLAGAVHYAHSQGVIHRDLKPSNVMLDEQGEPHLSDFGLARRAAGDGLRTLEGLVLGTPAYMSPEQAQGQGHLADARSDLWSLGVMLYELLTARRPFEGDETEIILAIRTQEPARPRSLDRSIPKDLETIVLKCLAKNPGGRYATCAELAEELERWLRGEPIAARPIGLAERAWRWTRGNPMVAGLTSLVGLLLVALSVGSLLFAYSVSHSRNAVQAALGQARAQRTGAQRHAKAAQANLDRWRQANSEHKRIAAQRERIEQARIAFERAALKAGQQAEQFQRTTADQEAAIEQANRETQLANKNLERSLQELTKLLATPTFPDYIDRIRQTRQLWLEGRPDEMHVYLDACSPKFRSWEWGYLKYLATHRKDHAWDIEVPLRSPYQKMTFSADGQTLLTLHYRPQPDRFAQKSSVFLAYTTATGQQQADQEFRQPPQVLLRRKQARGKGSALYSITVQHPGHNQDAPLQFDVLLSGTGGQKTILRANWSPDARALAVVIRESRGRSIIPGIPAELIVIDSETQSIRFQQEETPPLGRFAANLAGPEFSSDNRWICMVLLPDRAVDDTGPVVGDAIQVWDAAAGDRPSQTQAGPVVGDAIQVWDAVTGEPMNEQVHTLRPLFPNLTQYSADFRRKVAVRAGAPSVICLQDTATGLEVMPLDLPPLFSPGEMENYGAGPRRRGPGPGRRGANVSVFAFSPDGKYLVGSKYPAAGEQYQTKLVAWESLLESP